MKDRAFSPWEQPLLEQRLLAHLKVHLWLWEDLTLSRLHPTKTALTGLDATSSESSVRTEAEQKYLSGACLSFELFIESAFRFSKGSTFRDLDSRARPKPEEFDWRRS